MLSTRDWKRERQVSSSAAAKTWRSTGSQAATLWLVVIAGAGPRHQPRLVDLHLQVVILKGLIRTGRIERERIKGARVPDTTVDFARQVVAWAQGASAALYCQHLQTQVGGIRFSGLLHPVQIILIEEGAEFRQSRRNAVEGNASLPQSG